MNDERFNRDFRRACSLVYWHRTGRRARAFRTVREEWAAIRLLRHAINTWAAHGYVGPDPQEKDRGV